ncbi:MAG TPA: DUF72 domain-containing protein, partial [Candidatus Limnocylindrales bacterium]|nr:DUF72 domain-containing protein [Candidatus Limnocylindrales bacterium]
MAGRLRTGTSGFAYPAWSPRFYPPGIRGDGLLRHYGSRLATVELNNTFYRQPSPSAVDGWLAATPADFRFSVKAQRGGSFRSLQVDPGESVPWLTAPLRRFGDRLGTILFRVPDGVVRNDERLTGFLAAWPADLPLAMEFQDASWHVDEVFATLRTAGAALVTTELAEDEGPPTIRRTGGFLYLRLRRHDYTADDLATWLERLEPFIADGLDAYVYFRHDDVGRGAELALELAELATHHLP